MIFNFYFINFFFIRMSRDLKNQRIPITKQIFIEWKEWMNRMNEEAGRIQIYIRIRIETFFFSREAGRTRICDSKSIRISESPKPPKPRTDSNREQPMTDVRQSAARYPPACPLPPWALVHSAARRARGSLSWHLPSMQLWSAAWSVWLCFHFSV